MAERRMIDVNARVHLHLDVRFADGTTGTVRIELSALRAMQAAKFVSTAITAEKIRGEQKALTRRGMLLAYGHRTSQIAETFAGLDRLDPPKPIGAREAIFRCWKGRPSLK